MDHDWLVPSSCPVTCDPVLAKETQEEAARKKLLGKIFLSDCAPPPFFPLAKLLQRKGSLESLEPSCHDEGTQQQP